MDTTEPPLRKPSQLYVDNYIARRGEPPSPRTAAVTPRGGQARRAARIFYQLDEECPTHYYPKLKTVNPFFMRSVCVVLQLFCLSQILLSAAILYYARNFHDSIEQLFAYGANLLCAFAALCGLCGVCASNRSFLLFFYINQLWGLSNVCTFFVMYLESNEKNHAACLEVYSYDSYDIPDSLADQLDCADVKSTHTMVLVALVALLTQLWMSCFLAKTYSELLQDAANDTDDKALINFVWERRRETWLQLRRFEDVVQRQFEELRSSLVNRQGLRTP